MAPSRKRPGRYGTSPASERPLASHVVGDDIHSETSSDIPLVWSIDEQSQQTINYLVTQGRLERVDARPLHAASLVTESKRHLVSALTLAHTEDISMAFVCAYDAARKALTGILAHQGLRTLGGDGGHAVLLDAVRSQFPDDKPTLQRFDWLRTTRNDTEYRSDERPTVTRGDVEDAITAATLIVDIANRYLRQYPMPGK